MNVKRLGWIAALVLLGLAAAAVWLAHWPGRRAAMVRLFMKPRQPFAETVPPTAYDYAEPSAWLLLPEAPGGDPRPADLFFVHPTTFMSAAGWNQPPGHATAEGMLRRSVVAGQAMLFADRCRPYAPHYRQATLYAFLDAGDDGPAALDLAYGDVLVAFEYFLEHYNDTRPFVLAAHSQGSFHALRLLEERIAGSPAQERLVAAYLPGVPLPRDKLSTTLAGMPVCAAPLATGCVISWNSVSATWRSTVFGDLRVREPSGYRTVRDREALCVNPLTWRTDGEPAPASANRGAKPFDRPGSHPAEPTPGVTGAACRDGLLWIDPPEDDAYRRLMLEPGSYHLVDYNLFHVNVSENVAARVEAFLARRPAASAPDLGDRPP